MKITTNSILVLFGIIALAIMACLPISIFAMPLLGSGQPSQDDAAATLQVIVSQTMSAMTQSSPTPTLSLPTVTPLAATSTPVPATNTPLPTATKVTYCDWVTFVKDVTIPDGTKLAAGDTFTKTWRLQNRGTCTWTSDYLLVFSGGDQMGGTTAVRLPGTVYPGQSVDISVTLTAPDKRGRYVGYWMLRNPYGQVFGYGDKADKAFYVDIRVENMPYGTVSGSLCYPSEFNPPLTLYFEDASTGDRIEFSIPENQNVYSVLLPKGTWYAYAWAPVSKLEGAYTDSSGLMKAFEVRGGETTANIHLCDWSPYPHGRVSLP